MNRLERFMQKVAVDPETGCWRWTGAVTRSSSGKSVPKFYDGHSAAVASRWIFEQQQGHPLPRRLRVFRTCGDELCVNPEHTFLGTFKDYRNTYPHLGMPWLMPDENIHEIRLSSEPAAVLAEKFGITQQSIWAIRRGKTYQHVFTPGWAVSWIKGYHFWPNVDQCDKTGHWFWRGHVLKQHYGDGRLKAISPVLSGNGTSLSASRIAWQELHGELPDEIVVIRRCDEPLCVNPEHHTTGHAGDWFKKEAA